MPTKYFNVILVIFLVAAFCRAQDDTSKFSYKASKGIPVGTVLHYVKTNIDGSQPEQIAQFIASPTTMEAFKFHPKELPAGLVIAEMDWETFSAKSLTSWRILSAADRKLFGTIDFGGRTKRATVSIPAARSGAETFAIDRLPVHLYNFDLGSLNFAFPHLKNKTGTVAVGIADPSFRDDGPLVEYKGEVTISYQAEEIRNRVPTRKYRIEGPGLKDRGGAIWVNKKHGWIEDIEIDLPDNPAWKSFKLRLLRVETKSRSDWDRFIVSQF